MASAPIHIIRLSNDNMKDAHLLYKEVLRGELSFESFSKKYDTVYTGVNHCAHIAYAGNKPIGFYGIVPSYFLHKGKKYLGAEACDFATVKEFRGQAINAKIATQCYEVLKEYDCHFVFGLHSFASYTASKKMHWIEVKRKLFLFRFAVNTFPFVQYMHKLNVFGNADARFKTVFAQYIIERNSFTNLLNSDDGVSALYDEGFLQYKTFSPNYVIEILGVKFWVKMRSFLEIGAVYYKREEDFHNALKHLIQLAKKIYVKEIIINASEGTSLYSALIKLTTPQPSWPAGYLNFRNEMDAAELVFNSADFDTY
ncbi:MAG: hypothetical protein H7Y00_10705 [Fimbriimonadaceae bacterium]|nr:hypothetical protein [Chitinophagales bacterium]